MIYFILFIYFLFIYLFLLFYFLSSISPTPSHPSTSGKVAVIIEICILFILPFKKVINLHVNIYIYLLNL